MPFRKLLIMLLAIALWREAAPAQEKAPEKFPRSGVLAVAGESVYGGVEIPAPVGSKPGALPMIGGSVSRNQPGAWRFKVFNNSKLYLAISVEVLEYGAGGLVLNRRPFSFRLRGGESKEQELSPPRLGSVGCELDLINWKEVTYP